MSSPRRSWPHRRQLWAFSPPLAAWWAASGHAARAGLLAALGEAAAGRRGAEEPAGAAHALLRALLAHALQATSCFARAASAPPSEAAASDALWARPCEETRRRGGTALHDAWALLLPLHAHLLRHLLRTGALRERAAAAAAGRALRELHACEAIP